MYRKNSAFITNLLSITKSIGLSIISVLIVGKECNAANLIFTPIEEPAIFNSFRATFEFELDELREITGMVIEYPDGFPDPPNPPEPQPPEPPLIAPTILDVDVSVEDEIIQESEQQILDEINDQLEIDLAEIVAQLEAELDSEEFPPPLPPELQPQILEIPEISEKVLNQAFLPSIRRRIEDDPETRQDFIFFSQKVPEPSSIISLSALGTLGVSLLFKRKFQPK